MIKHRLSKRVLSFLLITCLLAILSYPQSSMASVKIEKGTYIVDDVIGTAPMNNRKKTVVREEAKAMAYRSAIEQIFNEYMLGIREKTGYSALLEKVLSKASSIVKFTISNEILDENGILHVAGICKISEKSLQGVIGSNIIKALDNPRIMLLVDEKVAGKTQSVSTTHKEARRAFEKAGYIVVTPDQASPIVDVASAKVLDDPQKLYEIARTLRADVIVIGKASAGAFAKQKVYGVTLYGVSGSVQLKAIITQTSQEINSETFSSSTGRKPAGSVGEGASRCLRSATARATEQMLYKIAYGIASAGANLNDITINIKIANIEFGDVHNVENQLRELAGESGEIFERSYKDNLLEIVFTSKKTARDVASFLSEHGLNVTAMTNWTITANAQKKQEVAPSNIIISVKIAEVPSFRKSGELEALINDFVQRLNGKSIGKYQDKTLELAVRFPETIDITKIVRDIASFLEDNKIEIEGVSPNLVSGKLIKEEEKRRGLW